MGLFATYDEYATYAHESFPGCTWTRVHNSEETYISVQIVGYETVVDQKEEPVYRRFLFLCHGDCMMEKKMGINNDADRVEDIFDDLMWECLFKKVTLIHKYSPFVHKRLKFKRKEL